MGIRLNKCIATDRRGFGVSKGVRFIRKYFAVKVHLLIKHSGVFLLDSVLWIQRGPGHCESRDYIFLRPSLALHMIFAEKQDLNSRLWELQVRIFFQGWVFDMDPDNLPCTRQKQKGLEWIHAPCFCSKMPMAGNSDTRHRKGEGGLKPQRNQCVQGDRGGTKLICG